MEVHHHAHHEHGSDSHRKKNWKAYFWEFLMLFLAVFCGFLAETQREHMVEHQREKKFIGSLIEDLHTNVSTIDRYIQGIDTKIKMSDSLIHLLLSGEYKNAGSDT